jgi:hypothetical protein
LTTIPHGFPLDAKVPNVATERHQLPSRWRLRIPTAFIPRKTSRLAALPRRFGSCPQAAKSSLCSPNSRVAVSRAASIGHRRSEGCFLRGGWVQVTGERGTLPGSHSRNGNRALF